ncbi:hypothetical protein [Nocardioides massiliensis]|uniref:Uncharacterized protein (DUF3820 family) n=1 Tax=Nocardioides massiliensis TaxID=1325935 RepID=A0ABT9NKW6_9ACTN|nr:hypothetical protein [Nocardioides massiliensis]MDP9821065.1 uncharacterized protein (DUF3820 family) [Nocardioides massiliensis]
MLFYFNPKTGIPHPCVLPDCSAHPHYRTQSDAAYAYAAQAGEVGTITQALMPFGKYEGDPYLEVAEDRRYTAWLLGKAWFRKQHPDAHAALADAREVAALRADFRGL